MSIFQHHFSKVPIAWNKKGFFNTPSILISIQQRLLKPPDLLRRHPQTPPDPGRLVIALVQEAVDGPFGNAEIDGHLVQPIITLPAAAGPTFFPARCRHKRHQGERAFRHPVSLQVVAQGLREPRHRRRGSLRENASQFRQGPPAVLLPGGDQTRHDALDQQGLRAILPDGV